MLILADWLEEQQDVRHENIRRLLAGYDTARKLPIIPVPHGLERDRMYDRYGRLNADAHTDRRRRIRLALTAWKCGPWRGQPVNRIEKEPAWRRLFRTSELYFCNLVNRRRLYQVGSNEALGPQQYRYKLRRRVWCRDSRFRVLSAGLVRLVEYMLYGESEIMTVGVNNIVRAMAHRHDSAGVMHITKPAVWWFVRMAEAVDM